MILERGDIWSIKKDTDLILVTTNGTVKKNGELVMGRGFAQEVKNQIPWVPKEAGRIIKFSPLEYGCVVLNQFPGFPRIGLFQVKYNWWEKADLTLIDYSCKSLIAFLDSHPRFERVDLIYPGIGNGKLSKDQVAPIIDQLPDSVFVWEKN